MSIEQLESKFTRYEIARILGARSLQLAMDAPVLLKMSDEEKDEINLIITNPMFWKMHLDAKRNWVFLVWEGDKIPESFLEECQNSKIEEVKKIWLNQID